MDEVGVRFSVGPQISMAGFIIPNPAVFNEKLEKIKSGGLSKLHIVSDFDRTLTGGPTGGQNSTTSWGIFRDVFGEEYTRAYKEMFDLHHPIERDNTLSKEYRTEQATIWWQKHLKLLLENQVSKELILKVIKDQNLKLRDGVGDLFHFASQNQIPFLIFSAGVGDAIDTYLINENLKTENLHIISNFFNFDENGKAIGFQEEVVHTFNKNESLTRTKDYTNKIAERPNCILMGDSLHDANMTDGVTHEAVLKIGFLNGDQQERLDFEKTYDAIIEHDTDISPVNELLLSIQLAS